jgi:Flp pilus assembly pilin Flp
LAPLVRAERRQRHSRRGTADADRGRNSRKSDRRRRSDMIRPPRPMQDAATASAMKYGLIVAAIGLAIVTSALEIGSKLGVLGAIVR